MKRFYAVASAALDMRDFRIAREKAEAAAKRDMREGVFLCSPTSRKSRPAIRPCPPLDGDGAPCTPGPGLDRGWHCIAHMAASVARYRRIDAFEWKKLEHQAARRSNTKP